MSTTEMEEAILNGQPVAGPSSSSRSRSASPTNTDDELGSDLEQEPSDEAQSSTVGPPRTSGPQTGVKGVAADAKHQKAIDRHNKNEAIKNRDQYLLNKSFQAQTLDEEDADRRKAQQIEDQDEEERLIRMRREARMKELRNAGNNRTSQEDDDDQDENGSIYRQRLREVDADGFLKAVEQPGWTLVLLYELVCSILPYVLGLDSADVMLRASPIGCRAMLSISSSFPRVIFLTQTVFHLYRNLSASKSHIAIVLPPSLFFGTTNGS
jgi:hypothetical protein